MPHVLKNGELMFPGSLAINGNVSDLLDFAIKSSSEVVPQPGGLTARLAGLCQPLTFY